MNRRLLQIRARRARLLEQAASQRLVLAQAYRCWRTPLRYADLGLSVARALGQKPLWLTLFSAGLLGARTRGMWKWAARAWPLWTVVRIARNWRAR